MSFVALMSLLFVEGACSFVPGQEGGGERSPLSVAPERGGVRLVTGPDVIQVRSSHPVAPGDRIEVAGDDLARVTGRPGPTLELWGGTLEVVSDSRFRLLSGRLLVQTPFPIEIETGDLQISAPRGLFRVDRQLATRVANYRRTSVRVTSGVESLSVPAFRQIVTVQGVLPRVVQPLQFSASDRWDRRLLSEAIDLDARISNFARGLEAQLQQTQGLDFFSKVLSAGSPLDFLRPHLTHRKSDLLIGLMLSAEAARLQNLPLDLRFDRIFRLWTQGASWGLLAFEFGVKPDSLFSQLTRAVERAQIRVIGPGPGLLRPPAQPLPPSTQRRPAPSAPRTSPPRPQDRTARSPSPGALPPPVRGAVPEELNKIVDDLLGVVDPITGLPRL